MIQEPCYDISTNENFKITSLLEIAQILHPLREILIGLGTLEFLFRIFDFDLLAKPPNPRIDLRSIGAVYSLYWFRKRPWGWLSCRTIERKQKSILISNEPPNLKPCAQPLGEAQFNSDGFHTLWRVSISSTHFLLKRPQSPNQSSHFGSR